VTISSLSLIFGTTLYAKVTKVELGKMLLGKSNILITQDYLAYYKKGW